MARRAKRPVTYCARESAFKPAELEKLKAAMALFEGPEAMIVFRDVPQMDDVGAQKVRRWAIRALIEAAKK